MANILDLLPLLGGWEMIRIIESVELRASDPTMELYTTDENEMGWIVHAKMHSNVSDVELHIRYEPETGSQTIDLELNPKKLYERGATSLSNFPYVSNFDEVTGNYSAEFTPNPAFPVKGRVYASLIPGSDDANVNVDIVYIRVTDESTFLETLAKALSVNILVQQECNCEGVVTETKIVPLPPTTGSQYEGFKP